LWLGFAEAEAGIGPISKEAAFGIMAPLAASVSAKSDSFETWDWENR
jgi:hypothetical protein